MITMKISNMYEIQSLSYWWPKNWFVVLVTFVNNLQFILIISLEMIVSFCSAGEVMSCPNTGVNMIDLFYNIYYYT